MAAAYLEAWGRKDWAAMQARVAAPPADFAKRHTDMLDALRVTGASFAPGPATVTDDRAELPFQARLRLRALGEWPYQGVLRLVRRDDRWLVDWSPATLHPDLAEGLRFQRTRTWPERAPILAADGSELAGPGPVVTVSIVGERVKDPAEVTKALGHHVEVPRQGRPASPGRRRAPAQPGRPRGHHARGRLPGGQGRRSTRCPGCRSRPGSGASTTARPRPGCCSARSGR